MKKLLFVGILALVLAGCAITPGTNPLLPSKCAPVYVKVPVPVNPPAPPVVTRPALAIDTLTPASDSATIAKAYKASIKSLQGYSIQLETILDGYRNASVTPNIPTVDVNAPATPAQPASAASAPTATGN